MTNTSDVQYSKIILNDGDIDFEIVTDLSTLDTKMVEWDDLFFNSDHAIPTLSHIWVKSFFETMLDPSECGICIFAYKGRKLVGLFPVILKRKSFLGIEIHLLKNPYNHHSMLGGILVRKNYEKNILPLFIRVAYSIKKNTYKLSIKNITNESVVNRYLDEMKYNYISKKEPNGYGSYVEISGTFEEYYSMLSANFRGNLRKNRNKLFKNNDVQYKFLRGNGITEKDFQNFLNLEASGWKGKEGTAILLDDRLVRFYSAIVERWAALNCLEMHFLMIGDRPIAAQFGIRMNREITLFKIAYDERYSNCSPGNMLILKTIEQAFLENDIQEINCLTDMAWLDNFHMKKRAYYNVYFYPQTIFPYACYITKHVLVDNLKKNARLRSMFRYFRSLKRL